MVLMSSKTLPADFIAPDFNLTGIDGQNYSLESFEAKRGLVIIFMCVHCPYVREIEEKIVEIQSQFGENVQVVGINPNDPVQYPADSLEGMKARADEKGYNFVYLQDLDQSVAKAYEAVCTPDIYLFDVDRKLVYHGRIDELPMAIESMFGGDLYDGQVIPSQGCSIKWKG